MTNGLTILGVPIDNVSMRQTLETIDEFVRLRSFHQVATANVDFLVNAIDNPTYREVLSRCDLVIPDGMPIVLASRLLGSPLSERVAGSDLVPLLAERKYKIFLLGAKPEVSAIAADKLEALGARVVGRLSPPLLPLEKFDNDGHLKRNRKSRSGYSSGRARFAETGNVDLSAPHPLEGSGGDRRRRIAGLSGRHGFARSGLDATCLPGVGLSRMGGAEAAGAPIFEGRFLDGPVLSGAVGVQFRPAWKLGRVADQRGFGRFGKYSELNRDYVGSQACGPREGRRGGDGALVLDAFRMSPTWARTVFTLWGDCFAMAANRGARNCGWPAHVPRLRACWRLRRCEGLVRAVPLQFSLLCDRRRVAGCKCAWNSAPGGRFALCGAKFRQAPAKTLDGILRRQGDRDQRVF